MFRKLMAGFIALLWSTMLLAAVDVNKATGADLDTIKGIGPSISSRIIEERKVAPFKDWADLISRVKGVGESTAVKFSAGGLTVNGARYGGPAAATKGDAAKSAKDSKPAKDTAARPAVPAKAGAPS